MTIDMERLNTGIPAFELFFECGLCPSKSEAKRLISQGGAYVNRGRIVDREITLKDINEYGDILLRRGKKKYKEIEVRL